MISIIALVFAMTGTGIAAKSLITGKQIKDGSITGKDLAKNAVTAKNVAPNAITEGKLADSAVTGRKLAKSAVTGDKVAAKAIGAGALAPDSVTTASLNPESVNKALCGGSSCITVCPSGAITYYPSPCPPPTPPDDWRYEQNGTTPFQSLPPLNGNTCTQGVIPLNVIGGARSAGFDLVNSPPWSGRFGPMNWTLTVNLVWKGGTGTFRILDVSKVTNSGTVKLYSHSAVPLGDATPITQSFTTTINMSDGDKLKFSVFACGPTGSFTDGGIQSLDAKVTRDGNWGSSGG